MPEIGRDSWRRWLTAALILFLCSAMAACGSRSWRKGGVPGTTPYTVRGKTYYPLKSAHGFVEEGMASWYGPGFHGKKTANGERYDQYAMTAAHKLLPMDTTVKVTHVDTRRSITVRINDRGPFVDDRIIDLSRKGAEALGIMGSGTARVRVESVGGVPGFREDGDLVGHFFVQVGSFAVQDNAKRLVKKLHSSGFSARFVRNEASDLWHVQVGPWSDLFSAQKMLPRLVHEYKGAFVVGD